MIYYRMEMSAQDALVLARRVCSEPANAGFVPTGRQGRGLERGLRST